MTPNWLKAGLLFSGLLALFSFISVKQNPTTEGVSGRRRRRVVGGSVRVIETADDQSLFNLERGWHWFARRYADGRYSPVWHTTRDAARRGLRGTGAELWGYDEKGKRWVKVSWGNAGRIIA